MNKWQLYFLAETYQGHFPNDLILSLTFSPMLLREEKWGK